jgi:hypothetical protein
MSADRLHFMGSYHDPEPVELMDDDSSSNDSDDDMKSATSEPDIMKDDDTSQTNSFNGIHNDIVNNNTELLHVNGNI